MPYILSYSSEKPYHFFFSRSNLCTWSRLRMRVSRSGCCFLWLLNEEHAIIPFVNTNGLEDPVWKITYLYLRRNIIIISESETTMTRFSKRSNRNGKNLTVLLCRNGNRFFKSEGSVHFESRDFKFSQSLLVNCFGFLVLICKAFSNRS